MARTCFMAMWAAKSEENTPLDGAIEFTTTRMVNVLLHVDAACQDGKLGEYRYFELSDQPMVKELLFNERGILRGERVFERPFGSNIVDSLRDIRYAVLGGFRWSEGQGLALESEIVEPTAAAMEAGDSMVDLDLSLQAADQGSGNKRKVRKAE